MKNATSTTLSVFGLLSAAQLLFIALSSQTGIYVTKPLLLTTLSLWFYLQTKSHPASFSRFVLAGLIFSISGDVFLMFHRPGGEQFFIYGLVGFLIAQLFYIIAFSKYPHFKKGFLIKNGGWAAPMLLFLVWICWFLWDSLPNVFQIPVVVYAATIVAMALSSLHLKGRTSEAAFQTIFIGALFFVFSDSMIALTNFKYPEFPSIPGRLIIMATYLLGQFLIAKGAVKALQTTDD